MKLFDIFIMPDSVTMLHHTIYKPTHIGAVEWMLLWENVNELQEKLNESQKAGPEWEPAAGYNPHGS